MSISNWSSMGGITQNKDNASDLMYLVTKGDVITFNIITSGSTNYIWSVNKKDVLNNSNTFVWTVPYEEDIWEIHIEETDSSGKNHIEWALSTIPLLKAPLLFDYFCDKKANGRTMTDPWGRSLPEWSVSTSSKFDECIFSTNGTANQLIQYTFPVEHIYGTWTFWWKNPTGNPLSGGDFDIRFACYPNSPSINRYTLIKPADAHHRFVHRNQWLQDVWGQQLGYSIGAPDYADWLAEMSLEGIDQGPTDTSIWDTKWHKITTIHNLDGWWYQFFDEDLIVHTTHHDDGPRLFAYTNIALLLTGSWLLDNISFFDKQYLFPKKKIVYVSSFIDNWVRNNNNYDTSFITSPIYRNDGGISIEGQDLTLNDIYLSINNPSLFEYNSLTKTAICHTNLIFEKGSTFIMNGETLKMNCLYPGQLEIKIKQGIDIEIYTSTITTTNPNNHFVWNITGTGTCEIYDRDKNPYPSWPGKMNDRSGVVWSCDSNFTIKNSIIDNFSNLTLEGCGILILEDTQFTNIVNEKYGDYTTLGMRLYDRYKSYLNYPKGVLIQNRLPLIEYSIKNIVFSGKIWTPPNNTQYSSSPARISIVGGMWVIDDQTIQNITFINSTLNVSKGYKYSYYVEFYEGSDWHPSIVGLLNCPTSTLSILSDRAEVSNKYFVDIKVIDNIGIVSNASVNIINNLDDITHPSENLYEELQWRLTTDTVYERQASKEGYVTRGWYEGRPKLNKKKTFITDINGHTALPNDINNTVVMKDTTKTQIQTIKHTYTISASKDTKIATLSNFTLDSSWYRLNPLNITKTIVLNLDTGLGYIETNNCPIPICSITIEQI